MKPINKVFHSKDLNIAYAKGKEETLDELQGTNYEEGYEKGQVDILIKIDKFLEERTYQNKSEIPALIKFMPFEWEEFKKELR